MTTPFEAFSVNGMKLGNRFVRSATWEGLAGTDGSAMPGLVMLMRDLAENEVGLVISGYATVSPEGQSSPYQMAAWDDRFLPGLTDMAEAVHVVGGKIALQIVHGGKFSAPALTGRTPMGPSEERADGTVVCRAMSAEDIRAVVASFAATAGRAKRAGFDAVQLHGAHGFLISQFLTPAFNTRQDEYGGSLENRSRLFLEVVWAVRKEVGPDYPILVKMNSEDFVPDGLTREDALALAVMLERASVDCIELSGGVLTGGDLMPSRPGAIKRENEVYYREAARLFREQVKIPLMLVGGIRSIETAEEVVGSGLADFVSMGRPFIAEPDLVKRWHSGDRRKARCVSCNKCFGPPGEGKGLYCVVLKGDQEGA